MKIFTFIVACLAIALNSGAAPVWPDEPLDNAVARAADIIIAEISMIEPNQAGDLLVCEARVIRVIKEKASVERTLAVAIPAKHLPSAGKRYLLMNFGGEVGRAKFVANHPAAVVAVPRDFDVAAGKKLAALEQTKRLMAARETEVTNELARLEVEQASLRKMLSASSASSQPTAPSK